MADGTAGGRLTVGPKRTLRPARLLAIPVGFGLIALAVIAMAMVGTARQAKAADCPQGTVAFIQNFAVPTGSFDPGNFDLPPNITISKQPGPAASNVDLIQVSACLQPGEGATIPPPLEFLGVRFTTPTPIRGSPVAFVTPTNTPTLAPPTAVPTATPSGAGASASTGIRPPSTGDGGLKQGSALSLEIIAFTVLCGGLAIGTAPFLARGTITDSGRREE